MAILKQNAVYTRTFLMVYKTDHLTGATGVTITVNLAKAGAALAPAAGSVSAISSGLYSVALTTADTNTLGDLSYYCTGTNVDPTNFTDQVIGMDLNIPVVVCGTNADKTGYSITTNNDKTGYTVSTVQDKGGYTLGNGVNVTQWAGGTAPSPNVTGVPKSDVIDWLGSAPNSLISGRVDSNAQVIGDKTGYLIVGGTTGRVTGNVDGTVTSVTGNVSGSVSSVVNSVVTGTNADKAGYSLTSGQLFVKKNTALANFMFLMLDSSDHVTPKTGLTITSTVSIDGAAFGATANSASEIGSGVYKINLAAADTNGTVLMFKFSSAGADTRYIEIIPQT